MGIPVPRLLIVLAGMAACLGASSTSCQFGDSDFNLESPSFVSDLTLRRADGTTGDTFDRGEPIDLVLTVRNRLSTPATVEFPTARTFDFIVVRANTTDLVWKWSTGRSFAQVLTEIDFAAGETRTFTVTWDQRDASGTPVPAGAYEARGVLVYDDFDANPLRSHQLASTLERLTIR